MSAHLHVRESEGKGRGVFCTQPVFKGETVWEGRAEGGSTEQSWATLQTDWDTHVMPAGILLHINHSCEPNCGLRANDHGVYDIIALRDIKEGEEITYDYCMSEWEIVGFSECRCGSSACRGTIQGAKHLPTDFFERYEGYLAPYFDRKKMELSAKRP